MWWSTSKTWATMTREEDMVVYGQYVAVTRPQTVRWSTAGLRARRDRYEAGDGTVAHEQDVAATKREEVWCFASKT
ncbi:hypothetical protein CDD83_5229 [Cordyceps sp. RAO-2017]|nr:hypothetical protein CDD83_5229 [Cordyceps sp. RAO-2017]